jgi:hypothetical protein
MDEVEYFVWPMEDFERLQRRVKDSSGRLESRYDPENDIIPGVPRVTHTDHVLLDICLDLNRQIELLEERIRNLEKEAGHE